MVTSFLNWCRLRLTQHPRINEALGRTKLRRWGRRVFNRRLLKGGVHEADLLGTRLKLGVHSASEIRRFEAAGRERHFFARIIQSLQPGDVFLDIGANVGVVSFLAAKQPLSPAVSVHAFEPEPDNAAELTANARLNDVDRQVQVQQSGVGEKNEYRSLFLSENNTCHSILPRSADPEAIEVRFVTATAFAHQHQVNPSVVKIDVEGGEVEVLRGMVDLLTAKVVRDLFIEIHPEILKDSGWDEHSIQRWLEDQDFSLIWSEHRASQYHQHYVVNEGR